MGTRIDVLYKFGIIMLFVYEFPYLLRSSLIPYKTFLSFLSCFCGGDLRVQLLIYFVRFLLFSIILSFDLLILVVIV